MNSSLIKKILILVSILAVPGFLYFLLQDQGKNRYRPLPFFGPKKVATTFHSVRGKEIPDTIYHQVADFKLFNQNGDSLSFAAYPGKILVLNLFYSSKPSQSVDFTNKAMKVYDSTYTRNKTINFISLSIHPQHDTPAVLKAYAGKIGAKAGKWNLLTGDSTTVFDLINKGLFIDAQQNWEKGELNFTYSNMFVLLDPQHRIRGYYEASSQEDLSKLDDEIKVLITEELRNNKDGR